MVEIERKFKNKMCQTASRVHIEATSELAWIYP